MKNLLLRILVLAAMAVVSSFTVFGQTQCERDYRACVRACNTTRDLTRSSNNLARNQIRLQLARDLTLNSLNTIFQIAKRSATDLIASVTVEGSCASVGNRHGAHTLARLA